MFGRSSSPDSKIGDAPKQPAASPYAPAGVSPAMATGASLGASSLTTASVIGSDLTIIGQKINIVAQTSVVIDGDVRGDIDGRQVVIGQTGKVEGTVTALTIEVRGEIKGALRGANITLHPTSRVEGDILHQSLAIAEGAHFDGRVRRPKDASEIQPQLDVSKIANGT